MIADLIDVVGDSSRYGQPATLASLLSLLDIVCGRCSALYSGGSVVTGCLDELNVYAPLTHGQIVAVVCRVVSTGRSSMFLRILASTYEPVGSTKQPQIIASGYATFVAVDPKANRSRPLPDTSNCSSTNRSREPHIRLLFEEKEVKSDLFPSFAARRKQLRESSSPERQLKALEHLKCVSFKRVLDVDETEITIRKHFLPRHENYGGVVFGGDILETFENAALSCASRMQQKPMRTVAIRSISFLAPVQRGAMLHVTARVIACTRQTIIVLIRSFIDQESNRFSLQPSHYGVFYLAAQDAEEVQVGVRAWQSTHEDELHRVLSLPFSDIVPSCLGEAQSLS